MGAAAADGAKVLVMPGAARPPSLTVEAARPGKRARATALAEVAAGIARKAAAAAATGGGGEMDLTDQVGQAPHRLADRVDLRRDLAHAPSHTHSLFAQGSCLPPPARDSHRRLLPRGLSAPPCAAQDGNPVPLSQEDRIALTVGKLPHLLSPSPRCPPVPLSAEPASQPATGTVIHVPA